MSTNEKLRRSYDAEMSGNEADMSSDEACLQHSNRTEMSQSYNTNTPYVSSKVNAAPHLVVVVVAIWRR